MHRKPNTGEGSEAFRLNNKLIDSVVVNSYRILWDNSKQ